MIALLTGRLASSPVRAPIAIVMAFLAVVGCSIETIPSVAIPSELVVSTLEPGQSAVLVAGLAALVPARAQVTVLNTATGDKVGLTAGEAGDFATRIAAAPGHRLTVTAWSGRTTQTLEATVRSAGEPGVPARPGAGDGAVTVARTGPGQVRITGAAGAVPGGARVVAAALDTGRVAQVVADAGGSFGVDLGSGDGALAVVAIAAGGTSPALALQAPPDTGTPDAVEPDAAAPDAGAGETADPANDGATGPSDGTAASPDAASPLDTAGGAGDTVSAPDADDPQTDVDDKANEDELEPGDGTEPPPQS